MKIIKFLLTFFISVNAFAQSDGQQLRETFMEEFDPQGYAYYQYSEGLYNQGKQIAQSIAGRLDYFSELTETDDPKALMADFKNKMNNIDLLEKELDQQATNLFYNQADQLGNQLSSKDYEGALNNIMGSLGAYSEMRQQEKQLEAQRAELQRQKQAKMNEIRRKKAAYAKRMVAHYRERAAFTDEESEEKYYLELADYAYCVSWRDPDEMNEFINSSSSEGNYIVSPSNYTMDDLCPEPSASSETAIENRFIAQDIQLKKIAERKIKLHKEQQQSDIPFSEGVEYFIDGAIAYAAKAAEVNPTAENYAYLAEVQSLKSNILAFTSMEVARSIDAKYVTSSKQKEYDQMKAGATKEMDQALKENNNTFLDGFLKGGLDKSIKFDGKSLLVHAIAVDNPDAVQLILNRYIEGMNQAEINSKVQKAIMLCVIQDSPKTLKRFIDLGVSTDFTINNFKPATLAAKVGAYQVLEILEKGGVNVTNLGTSPASVLLEIDNNPDKAESSLESLNNSDLKIVLSTMIERLNSEYPPSPAWNLFENYHKAQRMVKSDPELKRKMELSFGKTIEEKKEVKLNFSMHISFLYLYYDLITLSENPLYRDFIDYQSPLGNETLAYVAFISDNLKLWEFLDQKLDFSVLRNAQNIPLLKSMEVSNKAFGQFISNDLPISFEDQLNGYIEGFETFPPGIVLKNTFKIDPVSWRNENGGTLLHQCIKTTLKFENYNLLSLNALVNEGVDKSIKNNDGETAYDLFVRHENDLKNLRINSEFSKLDMSIRWQRKLLEDWWKERAELLK